MSATLLVVEDEPSLQDLLRYNLEMREFRVHLAATGEEALAFLDHEVPDLILLDWMLPGGMSGLDLCRLIRARVKTASVPVIMLTARGEETQRIQGFSAGADDYVVKPFSVLELMARIQALLRRLRPMSVSSELSLGPLRLDRAQKTVHYHQNAVDLSITEFRLLEKLMQNPKQILTRGQLLDVVWGWGSEVEERTVDAHIARLRKSLCAGGHEDPIRTVRGVGYGLKDLSSS